MIKQELKESHLSTESLSEDNIVNFFRLVAYLMSGNLKAEFNMQFYSRAADEAFFYQQNQFARNQENCGTAGCAIGHGPYAGIAKIKGEDWNAYVDRCFIDGGRDLQDENIACQIFAWCFSSSWSREDNTPLGAAKRIVYMFRYGVPDFEDVYTMLRIPYQDVEMPYKKEFSLDMLEKIADAKFLQP